MLRTVPLSIIRSFSLYTILLASCQQTCMTYTIAVCTVKTPDDGQSSSDSLQAGLGRSCSQAVSEPI